MTPSQIILAAKALALLAALALAYWLGGQGARADMAEQRATYERTIAASAKAETEAVNKVRKLEQAKAQELAAIAEQYEQDKTDAEATHDRLVADLRAGNERLHVRWQAAQATARLSGAVASAAEPDAAERDRQESAGRIIAAADQCDAQVAGLQAVIRADRQ